MITPKEIKNEIPLSEAVKQQIWTERETIQNIIAGRDKRLLVVVGPCSIHDPKAAIDYARRLAALKDVVQDELFLVMRVYFEKPRTTIGWKGLINDPFLNDSCEVSHGLKLARKMLLDISQLGLPTATEFLDPIVPQYIGDLVGWAAIGARTTESQRHREMASGLSMPVGFKNGTDGGIKIAMDAMCSARNTHRFLGISQHGASCVIETTGNQDCHLVMRGGRNGPNYQEEHTTAAAAQHKAAGLPAAIMVDCSHANSSKDHNRQAEVFQSIIEQRRNGAHHIVGAMIESNIEEGNQKIAADISELHYGVSITDACINWQSTESLLKGAALKP